MNVYVRHTTSIHTYNLPFPCHAHALVVLLYTLILVSESALIKSCLLLGCCFCLSVAGLEEAFMIKKIYNPICYEEVHKRGSAAGDQL